MKSKTFSISIACPPGKVYEYVYDLGNLPEWATTFCKAIQKKGKEWHIQTPQGEMIMRMAPPNALGVLDHTVIPAPGIEVYVPMRVVANGEESEVMFTIFHQPGMSHDHFAQDMELIEQDLATLKRVLES